MNQKHAFWEALILAIFIFASGILIGYFIELNRTSQIITTYQQSEIDLLDIQIQQEILSLKEFDCDEAIKETINFADRIYAQAQLLDRYEDSSRLSDGILYQHKKNALLRAILFTNILKLQENCIDFPSTITYFYEFNTEDVNLEAKQEAFSRFLEKIKQEQGDNVILIPIAGNLEVNSVNLIKTSFDIKELPSILVDNYPPITSLDSLGEIRNYLK